MPTQVWDRLFVGSAPTRASIKTGRFDVLVLCAAEDQRDKLKLPHVEILRCPITDHPSDPLTRQELALSMNVGLAVAERCARGKRVLCACTKGLDRSPFIACLAIELAGVPAAKAIAAVKKARPGALDANPRLERVLLHVISDGEP